MMKDEWTVVSISLFLLQEFTKGTAEEQTIFVLYCCDFTTTSTNNNIVDKDLQLANEVVRKKPAEAFRMTHKTRLTNNAVTV